MNRARSLFLVSGLAIVLVIAGFFYWKGRPRDWQAMTIADVDRIHELILENHPGSVDPSNAAFRQQLETVYKRASQLALETNNSAGHFYTMRAMTVPFRDLHLGIGFFEAPDRQRSWPGFVVDIKGDGDLVVTRRDIESAPPAGARLVECEGRSVEELLADRILPYIGNWALPAKRPGDAFYLLMDSGNPFVAPLTRCTFELGGSRSDYVLEWQPADSALFDELAEAREPTVEQTTGLRVLDNGVVWISIATFGVSNPDDAAAFESLMTQIRDSRAQIADAPALVIDVRGNGGGSSISGREIASAIWGEPFIDDQAPRIDAIDWRASEFNLSQLERFLPMIEKANGDSSEIYRKMQAIRSGMQEALANGEIFFHETMSYPPVGDAAPLPVPAAVFFLTDQVCVSACLDFADLMMAIPGVTHIGQESSGDTHYLEVMAVSLPSGVAQLSYPTAAHRGRQRGDNESYIPELHWPGSMADTEGLESWIAELILSPEGS